MKKIMVLLMICCFPQQLSAQVLMDTAAIISELAAILERDQKTRTGKDSVGFMRYIDSCNLVQIEGIIAKYGWLGMTVVGPSGNNTFFFVIQHSDLATQIKYFPLLEESVKAGESKRSHLALMKDRILMRQGKNQIYGSQVVLNTAGEQEFYPIEDEKNVNKRRAEMGMTTLEEYAKLFGMEYKVPQN
jgi:hypothetical protein